MFKALIFDMDGVLVDSPKYIWMSFNQIFSKFGIKVSDEDIKNKYLGRSLRDQIELIRKDYNIEEPIDVADFSHESFETELNLLEGKINLNKDVADLIESSKNKGIKIAVATSSSKIRAQKILKILHLIDKLDVLITADDVENHKPNPDIYLKTSEELKINPEDCVVIEDAPNGILSAKNANMKIIGLVTKYNSKEALKDADLIINDFSEIDIKKIEELF